MPNQRQKTALLLTAALLFTGAAFFVSLCTGRYPLTVSLLLSGNENAWRVFRTLRLPRTFLAMLAGFALGIAGFVFQIVFKNPLASPDIIGVSSGACAGAAAAILLLHASAPAITACSFAGGLAAVCLALGLARAAGRERLSSLVLSGIVVNAFAQSALMIFKYLADPEKELASIEYWTMGSFSGVTASRLPSACIAAAAGILALFLLHRQLLLLSLDEDEARMLGAPVALLQAAALGLATLITAGIVSVTGVISFAGLLAPHGARLLLRDSRRPTMVLSGLLGSGLVLTADMIARSVSAGELPVSIPISLLGAPFLLWLVLKGGRKWD